MELAGTVVRIPAGTIVRLPYLPGLGVRPEACGCCMRVPLAHDVLCLMANVTDARIAVLKSARVWGTHPECLVIATAQEYAEYVDTEEPGT